MDQRKLDRARFAEVLRTFYHGRITNDQMEDMLDPLCKADPDLSEIFRQGVWGTYSDNRVCKFDPKTLTPEGRKILARWILFVKSGLPYPWPYYRTWSPWFAISILLIGVPLALWVWQWQATLIGFGLLALIARIHDNLEQERIYGKRDKSLWPFLSLKDFGEALRHPPYLTGGSNS